MLHHKTPHEILFKEKPDYNSLKVFGCLACAHNSLLPSEKFTHRGLPFLFLGYPPHKKGFKLINLNTHQEFISRDVHFYEHIFPFHPDSQKLYMQPIPPSMPTPTPSAVIDDPFEIQEDTLVFTPPSPNHDSQSDSDNSLPTSPTPSPIPVRRSTRNKAPPVWLQNFVASNNTRPISNMTYTSIDPTFSCFLSAVTKTQDPISFKLAVKSDHWVKAMNQELEALELNNTWSIMPLPPGKHVIGCKWLFKTKFHPDCSIEKHKARLVVLGCNQRPGEDYFETFAPVAKLTTVRALLVVAAMESWYTFQMDVSNAFLRGDLSETVFMKMPQGYYELGGRISVNMELHPLKS